jgi:hypothetical protein
MHERRSFGIAFSTTLFGVGLAAFLAYYIARSVLPAHSGHVYGWVPVVSLGAMVAAVGVGLAFFVSQHRDRQKIRALADFSLEGFGLRTELHYAKGLPELKKAREDTRDWENRLARWVDREMSDYLGHIANLGGQTIIQLDLAEGLPNLRAECVSQLDISLQRIADLTLKL